MNVPDKSSSCLALFYAFVVIIEELGNCLFDFSNIIDVRAYRDANIAFYHFLLMVKQRPKLSVTNNVR